jgi:beta-phosphoglucomutase-like phosphatase (HAD superfamily)
MPKLQGSIFDVDGVLVDSPHEKAWRESLRELMESSWRGIRDRTTWSPDAFTSHVYQQHVSGKPRMSGARAALDYFHVPDAENRVAEYARLKQETVVRLIQAGDSPPIPTRCGSSSPPRTPACSSRMRRRRRTRCATGVSFGLLLLPPGRKRCSLPNRRR